MSLLQYDFECKRINRNKLSNKESEDNDVKKPYINNKSFNSKWLAEFSWLRYDENKKRMYVCSIRKKINLLQKEQ
jgi:hypothetical protein